MPTPMPIQIAPGCDQSVAEALRHFDPFLDLLAECVVIDDVAEIRELTRLASEAPTVVFTFPSMHEVFTGTVMTRPGGGGSGPPLLLIDVSKAGLDTTHWARGVIVNVGFFDGPDFVSFRSSFAGSVGPIMAILGPRHLFRTFRRGLARRIVPATAAVVASVMLPGEGERRCWVREIGRGALRGTLDPGPLQPVGAQTPQVRLGLPTGLMTGRAAIARLDRKSDDRRDLILQFDASEWTHESAPAGRASPLEAFLVSLPSAPQVAPGLQVERTPAGKVA
jgi:hypothetical protein